MCSNGAGVHICTPSSWSTLYHFLCLEAGVHQASFQSDTGSHKIMMTMMIQCITASFLDCCAREKKEACHALFRLCPWALSTITNQAQRAVDPQNLDVATCPWVLSATINQSPKGS